MLAAAGTATRTSLHHGLSVWLLAGALVLLMLGFVAVAVLWRGRAAARPVFSGDEDLRLAALMLASLPLEIREYLSSTAPAPGLSNAGDISAVIERLAFISIDQPPTRAADVGLHDLAIGLAVLESKVGGLRDDIARIEQGAVSTDRLVWTVLTVTGALVGVLGGIATLIASVAQILH